MNSMPMPSSLPAPLRIDSIWLATATQGPSLSLSHEQLSALVLGLPWQRMGPAGIISIV